ncbi:MAG: hypothetical protein M5R42_01210 [Rhodocyclaceae bacterium]|nr:hypothetical protein [Rhodocyclaceae bacterium]
MFLQRLDLVADGGRRDMQFRRRVLETEVAGGGFEGAQSDEGSRRWSMIID